MIRKIDLDLGRTLDRLELLHDESMGSIRSLESNLNRAFGADPASVGERLVGVEGQLAATRAELQTAARVISGLERILASGDKLANPAGEVAPSGDGARSGKIVADASYLLLENRFRGSEEEIRERLSIYPQLFSTLSAAAEAKVLDLGCGRGELLALFKEAGVPAYGVDSDQGMLSQALAAGVSTVYGDGLIHLSELADHSLGGLTAIQVVEHLPRAALRGLLKLAASKVQPGGRVVLETINPTSLVALSSNYFRDLTHVFPLHPDTLAFEATLAGLEVEEVRFLSPVPAAARLQRLDLTDCLTPRWQAVVEGVNHTIDRLNELLYGHQDFCVIARVPESK